MSLIYIQNSNKVTPVYRSSIYVKMLIRFWILNAFTEKDVQLQQLFNHSFLKEIRLSSPDIQRIVASHSRTASKKRFITPGFNRQTMQYDM